MSGKLSVTEKGFLSTCGRIDVSFSFGRGWGRGARIRYWWYLLCLGVEQKCLPNFRWIFFEEKKRRSFERSSANDTSPFCLLFLPLLFPPPPYVRDCLTLYPRGNFIRRMISSLRDLELRDLWWMWETDGQVSFKDSVEEAVGGD